MFKEQQLPENYLLALSPLQRAILEETQVMVAKERLNIAATFEEPHALVAADILCKAKLELLEDLLSMDERLREIREANKPGNSAQQSK